ncbi:MAG TPA: hypothetical protein PLR51_05295, partial [Methanomassiliicoccales archaeon]|nr:hypothetical protein [Methanomassiliicoccales archaeon]
MDRGAEDGVLDHDLAVRGHLGHLVLRVADELHAELPSLLVHGLPEAVGPDVLVQDVDLGLGVLLLDLDGVLDRLGAAHAAAVGRLSVPGTNALDHDHVLGGELAFHEGLLQLVLGDHLLVLAVVVLGRDVGLGAGGDHDGSGLQ